MFSSFGWVYLLGVLAALPVLWIIRPPKRHIANNKQEILVWLIDSILIALLWPVVITFILLAKTYYVIGRCLRL